MQNSTIDECKLINLDNGHDYINGQYSLFNNLNIPFEIKRVYYLYNVPIGAERGGHGHKELEQFIVAVKGSFDIIVNDSKKTKTIKLSSPSIGLLMPSGIWRELNNFTPGTICLVLASDIYREDDYFRDYKDYIEWKF
jgi:hypothetical protein